MCCDVNVNIHVDTSARKGGDTRTIFKSYGYRKGQGQRAEIASGPWNGTCFAFVSRL